MLKPWFILALGPNLIKSETSVQMIAAVGVDPEREVKWAIASHFGTEI